MIKYLQPETKTRFSEGKTLHQKIITFGLFRTFQPYLCHSHLLGFGAFKYFDLHLPIFPNWPLINGYWTPEPQQSLWNRVGEKTYVFKKPLCFGFKQKPKVFMVWTNLRCFYLGRNLIWGRKWVFPFLDFWETKKA